MTELAAPEQSVDDLAVIVLAAGQGTRLKSRLPKPLHRAAGRPLIDHVLRATEALRPTRIVVVTGHGAPEVRQHLGLDGAAGGRMVEAVQAEQRGTAHAVMMALPHLAAAGGSVVIVYADTPLVTSATLAALVAARRATDARLALVTCPAPDPTGYGRIVRDAAGRVTGIVEERVASPAERAIGEINAGFYVVAADWLRAALPRVEPSPSGEYYLTDLVALALAEAREDRPWPIATTSTAIDEALGVNDRLQLAEAEGVLRARSLRRLMLAGVTIVDPATTYIDDTVEIGADTIVKPMTVISGRTVIGPDCEIGPRASIDTCTIGAGCRVVASTLEHSTMEAGSDVGPYAHLRPGAHLGTGVHVGNFAEIKNSTVGAGTAVGHVSYLGDATVGERVNIGAGTITCNYDGRAKHRTIIGDGAFIGSDSMLVAPVEVGAGGRTGAGAVVTRDVPPGETVVGVPARPLRRASEG